ncbi:reverse transcriptase domain-containing protein, partial [Plesiomonas shigelloides]
MVLLVYVDDILIIGPSISVVDDLKLYLTSHFQIKDLRLLIYFFGIEVVQSPKGFFLCQRKYALNILQDCGFTASKPALTPMDANVKLHESTSPVLDDPKAYQRLIGCLVYLTIKRPDIRYAVSALSQFLASTTEFHLQAAHHIVRYIKRAPGQGLFYSSNTNL